MQASNLYPEGDSNSHATITSHLLLRQGCLPIPTSGHLCPCSINAGLRHRTTRITITTIGYVINQPNYLSIRFYDIQFGGNDHLALTLRTPGTDFTSYHIR